MKKNLDFVLYNLKNLLNDLEERYKFYKGFNGYEDMQERINQTKTAIKILSN
jgi:hypothetical protein